VHSELFELDLEEDVAGFLGVDITPDELTNTIELKQTGLIRRVLKVLNLEECNGAKTPAEYGSLGKDIGGEPFTETWNYRSVVGMMLYLSSNSRPDIAFAVSQCAKYGLNPTRKHAEALKRIGKYLKETQNRGMIIKTAEQSGVLDLHKFTLDCYVDADFAGLWNYEDVQDPTSVKSRTGFVITLGEIPVQWGSKLQTEVALSTMESEYIAASSALRHLIPLRLILDDMCSAIGVVREPKSTISTVWEDNAAALSLMNLPLPRVTPRSKHFAVKYHWFRQHIMSGELQAAKIASKEQKADIYTKGLRVEPFEYVRKLILGW
jgi:hypothetical protein